MRNRNLLLFASAALLCVAFASFAVRHSIIAQDAPPRRSVESMNSETLMRVLCGNETDPLRFRPSINEANERDGTLMWFDCKRRGSIVLGFAPANTVLDTTQAQYVRVQFSDGSAMSPDEIVAFTETEVLFSVDKTGAFWRRLRSAREFTIEVPAVGDEGGFHVPPCRRRDCSDMATQGGRSAS